MTLPRHQPIPENEMGSAWMHRGMDLMETNQRDNLEEAARCFDQAITLRRRLPLGEQARHRYGLAAGWLNRGDALARLGASEQLAESVRSYDQALTLLHTLPLEEDPLYPRRLAIGWINRGLAQQKQGTGDSLAEAIDSFREAVAVLKDSPAAAVADLSLLRAGAMINLAGALLQADQSTVEARGLAQQALALIQENEQDDFAAAEAGFKARHILCMAVARESREGQPLPPELMELTTDAVEEGLALARHWEQRGEFGFRVLAEDLFRFGCRVYATSQPHFLAEFILESLDPEKADGVLPINRDIHEAAVAALWNALKEFQREGFPLISTPRFEPVLKNLRELRKAEERLGQLRGHEMGVARHNYSPGNQLGERSC